MNTLDIQDKPAILKAIELILAKPENIKKEVDSLLLKFKNKHTKKTQEEIQKLVINKIISNYSYYSAFTGGTTALTGVIPGIGTIAAVFGGATADAAISMKYQIEMTMALATVYGHDILIEEEKRLCMLIAGLGALTESTKQGVNNIGSKAFINLVRENLKGSTLIAVKEIFKKIGITFTRKALEKSIPFGVGVIVGFSANKLLSLYVASKAVDFFNAE